MSTSLLSILVIRSRSQSQFRPIMLAERLKSEKNRSRHPPVELVPQLRPLGFLHHSSTKESNSWRLNIITSNPMVTMISNENPNHPNIIAAVPTPLWTLPFPKSCAIVLAATEAVCCHNTLTRTKTAATKISARAACDTGREGKRLTSFSEPDSSISSCHPGNVARRRKQTKARIMATILVPDAVSN